MSEQGDSNITTEDFIAANHIDPATSGQDSSDEASDQAQGQGATTVPQETQPHGTGTGADSPTQPTTQQQPQQTGQGNQDPQQQQTGRTRRDAQGNVTDQSGNILARAGHERRIWERAEQATRYARTLERDIQQLRAAAEQNNALNDMPRSLGLQPNEVQTGLQIAASFKQDPIGTLKYLLTETQAMGHNVNTLLGQQNGVDMNAIARMIDNKLGPLQKDREQQARYEVAQREAQREYQAFVSRHEYATVHEDAILRLMQADPQLSPDAAYYKMQAYAATNGLDFSKPLAPQIGAARGQGSTQISTQQGPSMPSKSGNAPVTDQARVASEGDSWADIINTSMRDAGLRQ